ncbi:ergothioneine biosynthesis PLP-dependent enzyme EgtE [Blastococcus sp. TML/M2B]|uniref:ergothioneine biosynthesis PLP-dependent enzyme EgtE n=1 Tax=unclassified Blastococcus TaxID=2619396 RepID=UPI00190C43E8|nr:MULTISPECIES: ergothioneine biosynthesis PLP-dependent enzyme EgtE [unclassified Blastococcus]MBN1091124.1 ergothioneine biosynthesis PLP-dependent enzyme EgtE [Blastococcus sp. TML/M2B]MBN1094363.1 ergothioneine biosynthesis PLP-dependent enzyme EgtE [Blastococcus sp. TML/M2B]MBN1095323.1 ergothioneine biosynthesis PLP-dependent enzyme EgtE [Blastococcus sp. TML/C7B]
MSSPAGSLPHDDLAAGWRKARPRPAGRHLDSAASGRQGSRALEAAAHHARHEAELGGYVAQAAAENLLQQGRSVLGGLVGMAAADVAFVESARGALAALLTGWRLPAGTRVACLPGEYAPNIGLLGAYALRPEPLPVDDLGRADLEALERQLGADPPRFVHLDHVPSHRGVRQPAAEIAALCRAAGVPLVLDAAQALGHVDTDVGADVVYGTSRKWLAGPRGVGVLAARPAIAAQLTPVMPGADDLPPMRAFESGEGHIAGRIGLIVAVGEHLAAGPDRVRERLAGIGRHTRELLDGRGGWTVVEPVDEPTATTTLRPPDGVDVVATRARLLADHGIVVSALGRERAPGEMTGPVLRVSPHLDVTVEDLEALAAALPG